LTFYLLALVFTVVYRFQYKSIGGNFFADLSPYTGVAKKLPPVGKSFDQPGG